MQGRWRMSTRARTALGVLSLWLMAAITVTVVLAGQGGGPADGTGLAVAAAVVLLVTVLSRLVPQQPALRATSRRCDHEVAACRVSMRDPDAPGRGSRPRAPDGRPGPAH